MKILQTVVVKQILTEESKQKLLEKYQEGKLQMQKESEQLHFELKRLEKTKKFQMSSLKNHFEKEIQKRGEKEKFLDFQIEQLELVPLGSELKEKEVQALIDLEVGDNWEERAQQPVIVIKDGIITEIR